MAQKQGSWTVRVTIYGQWPGPILQSCQCYMIYCKINSIDMLVWAGLHIINVRLSWPRSMKGSVITMAMNSSTNLLVHWSLEALLHTHTHRQTGNSWSAWLLVQTTMLNVNKHFQSAYYQLDHELYIYMLPSSGCATWTTFLTRMYQLL